MVEFIDSRGKQVIDPDGGAPTWEVPIAQADTLERMNFSPNYGPDEEPRCSPE